MRKNTKRLIALLMTITMILAVCPVEIFAAGDDTAVSTVPAAVTDSADTAEDTPATEEASASEDTTISESEAPVSDEQSEAAASQETSANATALQKSSGLLPAPALRYQKSSAAAAYIVTAVFEGEGTAEQPYLITSSADWDALSSAINSGNTAYAGKYFKLTDNITVTTMLGYRPGNTDNDDYVFSGTFDGGGHTLNVNINTSLGFAAPFAIAHNAVIKNLKVTGSVTSTGYHATGLVGASKAKVNADESSLTIQNVTVSTDVSCTSHIAGIIGHAHQANITMENVVFDGSLNASSVQGGFIGWGGASHGFNASFKDCLFAGTYKSGAAFHPIAFASGQGTVTLINDFYTTSLGNGGSPIAPTGSGSLKILAAAVENQGKTHYFDNIATAASSENWTAGSTLKLMSDVSTASTITVPVGSHTLDLNGHTVKAASAGYSVITVGSGAALVIDDTAGGGKITGGSVGQNYGGGITVDAGTLTLRGGAISGNANTYGAIGYCSGGVLVKNSGKFYMEGGEISANTSYVGGGVCCDTSATTVIITGGEIKNNKITRFGSGVLAGRSSSATFKIGGDAKIVDNISTWTSDKNGEASVNFSKLSISGNPTVRGCWKTTGNSAPNAHINLDNNGSSVQRIALDGALTNESGTPNLLLSPIYRWNDLQSGKTFVFTENWSTYMGTAHPADYFGVDASVSGVRIIRKDGEAAFTGSSDLGDLYITYDANGGTGEMDAQLVSTTSAVLNQNSFTNGDKEFIGWNTKADGSGTPYSDKGDITLSGDVTLYAQWAEKHAHDDVTFSKWEQTSSLPTKAGDYYLGADVTISSTWNVPSGTVNLCLNGHGIKMVGSGSVINVGSSAVLNVYDCGETEHKFTVNSPASNGAGCAIVNDSLAGDYKTFTGGYITGGNARNGGGIKVNGTANLTLNGGTIIGNQSSFMGAGIKADNNGDNTNINITVNGGAVIYNTVNGYGSGICSDGAVRVNGGTIAYNYATKDPGGIHCHYLYLSGGSIVNNYADDNEYSAGVHADHEVFISGNPVISDNVYKGTPYNLDWDRTELAHGHKLNITGALSEDTQISVTLKVGGTGVFTNGWKANMGDADPAKYFTSDNRNYSVSLNQDGEAEIGVPPVASIISGETVTNYGTLADAISAWTVGSTLKLLADVTTSSTVTAPSGEHTLDLNGHGIKMTGNDRVITVPDTATLNISDSEDTVHYLTLDNYRGTAVSNTGTESISGGTGVVKVTGGYITGGYCYDIGSGICVRNGGNLVMNGGTIIGNVIDNYKSGAGIRVDSGGYATLAGDTHIVYNRTPDWGGAIALDGILNIKDQVEIKYNYGQSGIHQCGILNLSGNPIIRDNVLADSGSQSGKGIRVERPLTFDGALTEGASISVALYQYQAGVFTSGWKDTMGSADPAEYFTSDSANYSVFLNQNGEAEIGVPPVASIISGETTTSYGTFDAAVSAWLNSSDGATLKLLKDVSYTDKIILSNSKKLVLDLNGKTYTRAVPSGDGTVFDVNSGANFTLTDTSEEQTGVVTRQSGNFGGTVLFVRDSGSVINYDGGKLTGFTSRVIISWQGSTVNMSGGEISGNNLINGDATDGIVRTYSSTSEPGGTFNMTGGKIINNTLDSGKTGGAVYVGNNGTFNISGNVEISGNTQDGKPKNVYLPTGTTMNVTGALGEDALICVTLQNGTGVFTNGWKANMGADPTKYFVSDNTDYTVILKDGEAALEYPPVPDVSASGYTGDYDGAAHSIAVSVPTGATVQYGTKEGEYSLTENPSYTDAGTYNVYYKVTMDKHTPVEGSAVVTINQIDVTVTITGHNTTVNYDGKAHSADGYDFAADTTLYTAADFTFSGRAEAVRTDAGTTNMGLAASQFANTNDNFDTVTFNVSDGFVKINPINVTVTITGHTVTADYDGKAHSVEGYDFAADSTLYTEADFTFSGSATAERTNVGTTNMELAASQFVNTNENFATVTFNVSDGFVKINPINVTVTITGHTVTSDYDGKAHSVEGYDFAADSTLYTEADFTFDGTAAAERTDAGKTDMGLTAAQFSNTNGNFATVTFHVTDGFVKIDPIDVTVTITGHHTTVDFNAETHSADGYDFATDNALYTAADFTFDGRAEALRTNAGTTYMGLTASQFKNTNKNFATVVFDVSDGFVKVNQINAVVTITGQHLTADYDGNTHSVAGYAFESDTPLYTAAYVTFSGNAAAERREAGTTQMGLAASQFENTNENFATVTFNVKDGYVTINPITAVVTVTGHTNTAPYNGKAHTVSGYDASANTALYDVEKDFAFTGSANAMQTDAGTAKMGLTAAQFKNTNPNFASVIFKVTDGWQKITRVDASIKSAPHAKNNLVYSGDTQALIVPGTAVGGTLYYAIGANDTTVPAGAQFKQTLPAAKEVGNYYIWYKVAADKNHNSLAPKCFKVTLAEPAWESISGKILNNDNTPAPGAKVILMRGNEVVDTITSDENGEYYFTVPKGVYNMVVKVNGVTVTNIADVTGNVNSDITLPAPNTDSVLDIVSSDKSIAVGGLEQEANLIRKNENIPDDVNVTVKMTVQAIAESDTDGSKAITSFAKDKYIEFYNLSVEKTVGSVTTKMNTTQTVMEIVIPCSFTNKRELQVFTCDGGDVTALTESDSGEPGTYRVDTENGLIYIYTTSFATVALAYQPYFSVTSFLSLGSYTGNVSVKLEKESGDKIFELNDVSVEDIAFKGVPRGTYIMTVQWVDGAENTITMPFNIK